MNDDALNGEQFHTIVSTSDHTTQWNGYQNSSAPIWHANPYVNSTWNGNYYKSHSVTINGMPMAMPITARSIKEFADDTLINIDGESFGGVTEFMMKKIGRVLSIKKCGSKLGVFFMGKLVAVFDFGRLRECDDSELRF